MSETQGSTSRAAALYLSHGAPPLLDDEIWGGELSSWSKQLVKPKAILIVSAHWESEPLSLSATEPGVPLIYDFGGFAPRYYQLQYPAPVAPEITIDGYWMGLSKRSFQVV